MTDELWTKIVEEVAQKSPDVEFWPTFYGEALVLGKKLFRKIRQARALGMTNIVLNSNGSYCTDEMNEEILTCGLKRFILSLDGFTKETFEHIRYTLDPKGKYEPVHEGIHKLLARKKELDASGIDTPLIICQFSEMEENEHETEAFTDYWLSRGVDVKTREKCI